MLNDLKKLQVKNWTYLVTDRKTWYKLMQKTKMHKECWCQQQHEKEE
jgi:hypothetical protein